MDSNDIRSRLIEEELRSVWPGWHVARRLGGGSFGDVFQIYRDNYGIRVESALKVIQMDDWMATVALPSNSRDESSPDIPEVLRSEIQIMEALRGAPNIVSIEDFAYRRVGQTSTLLVRMELLKSLQEVLPGRNGQGTLSSIREITKLGKDVCRALMYCEKRGIIHRDIKPANLFVDRFGDYKVGDFGASKRMETVHVAQTMTGIGTISYMAPEIFRGQSYNNTVDIYALGLVLYQLLNNGRMAFLPDSGAYTTQDIDSANYHRLHGTPVPSLVGKYVGGERIDSRLDAAVRKACAMNPSDRYRTAKEFYDALALTEMPEKKAEPEYERRAQSSSDETEPLQGRQEYRKPEPEIKHQSDLAAASHVQGKQQERQRTRAETGTSAAPRQAPTTPPVRPSQSQPQKNGQSGGNKSVIAIVLVCIIVAVALTVLVSQRGGTGSSAGADQGEVAQTEGNASEEENTVDDTETETKVAETQSEGNASEEENTVDDSVSDTEVVETATEERDPGPISDSWEEIIAAGEDGTYIDKYQIGDTKELDLGEEGVIETELVAFDTDELADGSGKAHMTWVARNLLNSEHAMNENNSCNGGWPDSDMRYWLHDSILPKFPEALRTSIKEVTKYSMLDDHSYGSEGETIISTDKIWIPSLKEISDPIEDKPLYYSIGDDLDRIYCRTHLDEASDAECEWWVRDIRSEEKHYFYVLCKDYNENGQPTWGSEVDEASEKKGVVIGFCF